MKRGKKGIGNIIGVSGLGDHEERSTLSKFGNTLEKELGFRGKINSAFNMLILSCCPEHLRNSLSIVSCKHGLKECQI